MPSNERISEYLNLKAQLRRLRFTNPAEVAQVINDYVERGGMHSDEMLWDHTNCGLGCNPIALLNLLEEAEAAGRVFQDRELAKLDRGDSGGGAPLFSDEALKRELQRLVGRATGPNGNIPCKCGRDFAHGYTSRCSGLPDDDVKLRGELTSE